MYLELVKCQCHVVCVSACYSATLAFKKKKTLLRVENISDREDNREILMWLSHALSFYLFIFRVAGQWRAEWRVEWRVVALRTLMDSSNDVFMYNCCVTVFLISARRLRTS